MSAPSICAASDPDRARAALANPKSFGKTLADLMVIARHRAGTGWSTPEIVPYGPLQLDPASKVLHYGLEIFEGHKAYAQPDGSVALFRPELNAERLNTSASRMCMPEVPVEMQLTATDALVDLLRLWVPSEPGWALYLRPMLIGTEASLGVAQSTEHLYLVLASPVPPYFAGCAPVAVQIEERDVRAAPGGTGAAKTGGNYASSLAATARARAAGFDQVLWLDAAEHRYLEELSAMNVFAVVDGVLQTPPLSGTILPGITRRSLLELAPLLGVPVAETPIAVDALLQGIVQGRVTEVFAAGTAAVITSIGTLGWHGERITVGDGGTGPVAQRLHESLLAIQEGRAPDRLGWMRPVPRVTAGVD